MDAANGIVSTEGCQSFGQEQFGGCDFGDRRLTDRAVISADAMMRHPGGTLPQKLPRAQLLGFYDFANNPKVDHTKVLEAHSQWTRRQISTRPGVMLIIHDTTEGDFSGLRSVQDLGPIGNGHCRGLLLHNVLAVDFANREAVGLVAQFTHKRRQVRKGESPRAKRQHPQRESRLWVKGVEAVGQVPTGVRWVNLMDRGGDTFESLERQQCLGQQFVVRSKSNRNVQVLDRRGCAIRKKLHPWVRKLPTLGVRKVVVPPNGPGEATREATVRVAAGAVRLIAPHPKRGEHSSQPLELWAVHVKEQSPPPNVQPLEWVLLTNVPSENKQQAWERVDWYECRSIVEEFHKAQKTGCGIQLPQFTTRKALEVTIGMLSVVAVQLLRLRDLSRRQDADARRAEEVVHETYVEVLSLWRFKQRRPDLSVKQFLYALARLGGHLGRTTDRPPGWLVLWRGWSELQRLVEGAQLMRLRESG